MHLHENVRDLVVAFVVTLGLLVAFRDVLAY